MKEELKQKTGLIAIRIRTVTIFLLISIDLSMQAKLLIE